MKTLNYLLLEYLYTGDMPRGKAFLRILRTELNPKRLSTDGKDVCALSNQEYVRAYVRTSPDLQRYGMLWTKDEDADLIDYFARAIPLDDIAYLMSRPVNGVIGRCRLLGLVTSPFPGPQVSCRKIIKPSESEINTRLSRKEINDIFRKYGTMKVSDKYSRNGIEDGEAWETNDAQREVYTCRLYNSGHAIDLPSRTTIAIKLYKDLTRPS